MGIGGLSTLVEEMDQLIRMKRLLTGIVFLILSLSGQAQSKSIAFISDTQAPMMVEKLWLKSHHNEKATEALFREIVTRKPSQLFMLGDVVSLGYKKKK